MCRGEGLDGSLEPDWVDVGRRFHVRLTAIDLAGNRTAARGKRPIVTWNDDLSLTVCLPAGPSS